MKSTYKSPRSEGQRQSKELPGLESGWHQLPPRLGLGALPQPQIPAGLPSQGKTHTQRSTRDLITEGSHPTKPIPDPPRARHFSKALRLTGEKQHSKKTKRTQRSSPLAVLGNPLFCMLSHC